MKKLISITLALVAVIACFALVSCADDKKGNDGNSNTPVETDHEHELLKSGLNFDGEEIRIVVASNDLSRTSVAAIGVDVDAKNGETLVDSVYDRNATVEAALNVDIQLIDVFPHSGFTKSVETTLIAGDDEYDIFFAQQAGDINLCLEEYIINLHDMSEYGNPTCYIQEDQDWWAHEYMDYYTYKNELYWLSSNLSMTYTGGAMCSMVNLEIYNRLFQEQYGSIYDVVKNGKYKEYNKLSSSVYTYSREDENERLLVVCSFVGKTKNWRAPHRFDLSTAELLLCNYEMSNRATLAPYECRVYRWKK